MQTRRWTNASQPQTLQMAVLLLYISAAFDVLFGGFANPLVLALAAGSVAAGYGIANERKWGYLLGVGVAAIAVLPYVFWLVAGGLSTTLIISAMFPVAMLALLLHPQSRDYQRIWFQ
jgi:hypothetical protein